MREGALFGAMFALGLTSVVVGVAATRLVFGPAPARHEVAAASGMDIPVDPAAAAPAPEPGRTPAPAAPNAVVTPREPIPAAPIAKGAVTAPDTASPASRRAIVSVDAPTAPRETPVAAPPETPAGPPSQAAPQPKEPSEATAHGLDPSPDPMTTASIGEATPTPPRALEVATILSPSQAPAAAPPAQASAVATAPPEAQPAKPAAQPTVVASLPAPSDPIAARAHHRPRLSGIPHGPARSLRPRRTGHAVTIWYGSGNPGPLVVHVPSGRR